MSLAHSSSAHTRPRSRLQRYAENVFVLFLIMAFVGITPFATLGDASVAQNTASGGNALRQIIYLLLFSFTLYLYSKSRQANLMLSIPVSTWIVLIWMFLSITWSISSGLSLRRAGLVFLITASYLMCLHMIGPDRALRLTRNVLAAVIVVDLVSVPIIPGATHAYFGQTAWAGMHGHKNSAGSVAALAALLFFHFCLTEKSKKDMFLFAISIIFLVGTLSKTSLALIALVCPMMMIYRYFERAQVRRIVFIYVFTAGFLSLILIIAFNFDTLLLALDDPDLLTDRGRIWQVAFLYARDHFWFGAGFSAFWDSPYSPVLYLTKAGEMASRVGHAHNSYVEMQVSLGFIGLLLTINAFIIVPFTKALSFRVPAHAGALCFGTLIFLAIGNITKSQFLDRDSPEWVFFLIILGTLISKPAWKTNSGVR